MLTDLHVAASSPSIGPQLPVYTPAWSAPKSKPSLQTKLMLRFGHLRHLHKADKATLERAMADAWAQANPGDAIALQPLFLAQANLHDGPVALKLGQSALRGKAHEACLPMLELALAAGSLNTALGLQAMVYAYVSRYSPARSLLEGVAEQRGLDAVLMNELGNVNLFEALEQTDERRFSALQRQAISLYQLAHQHHPQSQRIAQNLLVAQALTFGPMYGAAAASLPPLWVGDGTAVRAAILTGLRNNEQSNVWPSVSSTFVIDGMAMKTVRQRPVALRRRNNAMAIDRLVRL